MYFKWGVLSFYPVFEPVEKYMKLEEKEEKKKLIRELMNSELYSPMKVKELGAFMQVPKGDKRVFRLILEEMMAEGSIRVGTKGKLFPGEQTLIGTYEAHAGNFGFVIVEGRENDFFVSSENSLEAMNGDLVEVSSIKPADKRGKNREEAKVVRIVQRALTELVGTYMPAGKNGTYGFVIPDDDRIGKDVFVQQGRSLGAEMNMKVVVRFITYGDENHKPEGEIIEIIGRKGDPGVDIESIVKSHKIPEEFPQNVLDQAERVAKPVSEADRAGRKDLRDLMMVTIDGEDAKDLDDAVSLWKEGELYHLGVHIADVTNYVQEKSALDREALKRGTSVYLADRVIPMLPKDLSNGSCSLNQKEDRLTLSCLMTVDQKGKIVDSEICESVINVDRRMSYTEVRDLLEGTASEELKEECKELFPMFQEMAELSKLLRARRHKRGAIDFDFPEARIVLDEMGHPIGVQPRYANVATKLIEDFMLAANETVAETCCFTEIPFVYRTHENPDMEKMTTLRDFIANLGYQIRISREEVRPFELQKLLEDVKDAPEEALISRLVLRSMKQARYTTEPIGHFGLACQYYCHFTSPIRRYPDLQIHRIIKDQLRGRMNQQRMQHYEEILSEVAKHSSEMERRADEAERETEKMKKVEYMEAHIGETFDGVVSGVTKWGIYVELPDTIEGMIRLSDIPGDFYVYNEVLFQAEGQTTGNVFRLGQPLKVTVIGADRELAQIDFAIAGTESAYLIEENMRNTYMQDVEDDVREVLRSQKSEKKHPYKVERIKKDKKKSGKKNKKGKDKRKHARK